MVRGVSFLSDLITLDKAEFSEGVLSVCNRSPLRPSPPSVLHEIQENFESWATHIKTKSYLFQAELISGNSEERQQRDNFKLERSGSAAAAA